MGTLLILNKIDKYNRILLHFESISFFKENNLREIAGLTKED